MLCIKPYSKGVMFYGCGQCMPCRINLARMWTGRMLLESYEHPASTFVTLTYNPENCPDELKKCDLQNFIKRLRSSISPRKVRYYGVGEYGEKGGRPHYHIIVFGLFPTENKVVEAAWSIDGLSIGFSMLGTVEPGSVSYTLGYMMKRLTKKGDPRLNGKQPEFAIMSRKPGIGFGFVERSVKAYNLEGGSAYLRSKKWIGERFRSSGKNYPIGRYLKMSLLSRLGFEPGNIELKNLEKEYEVWEKNQGKKTLDLIQERKSRIEQQEGKIMVLKSKRRSLHYEEI